MPSSPERALAEARELGLDLSVEERMIETSLFAFACLEPRPKTLEAFRKAKSARLPWVNGMPVPILTFSDSDKTFRIMDGMLRICSAKRAGYKEFPALVASGETYDALQHILGKGYYGEDFVEMLAMVSQPVRENLELRKRRFLGQR